MFPNGEFYKGTRICNPYCTCTYQYVHIYIYICMFINTYIHMERIALNMQRAPLRNQLQRNGSSGEPMDLNRGLNTDCGSCGPWCAHTYMHIYICIYICIHIHRCIPGIYRIICPRRPLAALIKPYAHPDSHEPWSNALILGLVMIKPLRTVKAKKWECDCPPTPNSREEGERE